MLARIHESTVVKGPLRTLVNEDFEHMGVIL